MTINHPRISIGVPHPGSVLTVHFMSYLFMSIYEASKRGDPTVTEDIRSVCHLASIYEAPGCYVGMNRANLVKKFLLDDKSDSTHLLMIDTDVSFEFDLLDKIAVHLTSFPFAHVISGRVNLANGYPVFYREEYGMVTHQIQPFYGLKEFELLGAGILIVSKECLTEMVKAEKSYRLFSHIIDKISGNEVEEETEYGDDFSFIKRARREGYKTYGAWGIYGQHHKTMPVPQNYPEKIIQLAPSFVLKG